MQTVCKILEIVQIHVYDAWLEGQESLELWINPGLGDSDKQGPTVLRNLHINK